MSTKNKEVSTTLNYIKHFLTLVFAVTIYIFISAFASLIEFYNKTKYFWNNFKD